MRRYPSGKFTSMWCFVQFIMLMTVFLFVFSCSSFKTLVKTTYEPGPPVVIEAGSGSRQIRVGQFENGIGFDDPRQITSTLFLDRDVSEILRSAVSSELEYNGIDTLSGDLTINGRINMLDPLKVPEPVAGITFYISSEIRHETIHEFACQSHPSVRKVDAAIKDCIAQFFAARETRIALNFKQIPLKQVVQEPVARKKEALVAGSVNINDQKTVMFVQKTLNARGYDAGECDGILAGKSVLALNRFRRDCGLGSINENEIDQSALRLLKNPKLINDTKKPRIKIEKTRAIVLTPKGSETIVGQVTDESGIQRVEINGNPVPMDAKGGFSGSVTLQDGLNEVLVSAVDGHGNEGTKIINIRGKQNVVAPSPEREIIPGRYVALLIAVENYQDSNITSLEYALKDAGQLKQVLESRYTFEPSDIKLLTDPSRSDIINEFDRLSQILTDKDNLLVFYAGHGHWDEQFRQGYWLPRDAQKNSKAQWLSNSTIRDFIRGIKTRHTLLISDACFGGGIFKTRAAFKLDRAIQELYKFPSRKAMTSGTLTEVPDQSVFMEYLLKRLRMNSDDYLPSEELFSQFKRAVINNSPLLQTPQFGEIHEAGDEGGDFIFVRKN